MQQVSSINVKLLTTDIGLYAQVLWKIETSEFQSYSS